MSDHIIVLEIFWQYVIAMASTLVGVFLGFLLFTFHDSSKQKKERKGKLKSFVKNLIIEIEYNRRILDKHTDVKLSNFHYIRDSYFKSSMNSGLFHLIEHEDVQKLLPMHYHELEMYKNTTKRLKEMLSLCLQTEHLNMSDYKKHEKNELDVAESIRERSVDESYYLVKELNKLIS